MTSISRPGRRQRKQNLSICKQKSENAVQCYTDRRARGVYRNLLCDNKKTNRNAHKELSEWLRHGLTGRLRARYTYAAIRTVTCCRSRDYNAERLSERTKNRTANKCLTCGACPGAAGYGSR